MIIIDKIHLKRKLRVSKIKVVMELGKLKEKESYLAILKLAQENNDRVTPELIQQFFFEGRPLSLGKRIILRCSIYRLLDRDGYLTEDGKQALENNKIFMKEKGAYNLWITNDPLLPQKLIDLKPINIFSRENYKKSIKAEEIPKEIKNLENNVVNLLNKKNDVIKIYLIEEKIQKLPKDLNIIIHYIIPPSEEKEKISLVVSGNLSKNLTEIPNFSFKEVWISLLGKDSARWDTSSNSYKVHLREIDEKSRKIFLISKKFVNPNILNLGKFDDLEINGIPIKPINQNEAIKWAIWLLTKSITDYLTKTEYDQICYNIESNTAFIEYNIGFPKYDELIRLFIEKNENGEFIYREEFWYLQTPLDLDPLNLE